MRWNRRHSIGIAGVLLLEVCEDGELACDFIGSEREYEREHEQKHLEYGGTPQIS